MNPNGPIQDPDLRALLQAHRDEIFASFNCHQLGTVTAFAGDKYTASVQINAKRVVFNQEQVGGRLQVVPKTLDYPLLVDVPVFVSSGGGALLYMPIAVGDTCLVLFNDRDIDRWFTTGDVSSAPNSPRTHSLSDGLALVGFRSLANNPGVSGADAILSNGGGSVTAPANGWPVLFGKGGAFIQLTDKPKFQSKDGVTMKQLFDDLVTALDGLFTALSGWVNTGGTTPNPATLAAITAAKAAVDAVKTTVDDNFS